MLDKINILHKVENVICMLFGILPKDHLFEVLMPYKPQLKSYREAEKIFLRDFTFDIISTEKSI